MDNHHALRPFSPPLWLTNPHLQTLFPRYRSRQALLKQVPCQERLFQVDPHSKIKCVCSWQPNRSQVPTLIVVHGLEGCHESHYMRGIAHKAWHAGFNVLRYNQRNCAGTEHLTPTLYHGGMSQDIRAVISELVSKERLESIWVVGYSMGGNLVLKMAGEAKDDLPALQGVAAVCPNIHPAACVAALEEPRNWIYHHHFLVRLKARLARKAKFFPGKWDLSLFKKIRTLSQFDDAYTAPDAGYRNAAEYYNHSGARHVLEHIRVPTLIITSKDDPFIPFSTFDLPQFHTNPHLQLVTPTHGGHCGFVQKSQATEDGHWAENRIVEFIQKGRATGF